jgi:hypothetical protein
LSKALLTHNADYFWQYFENSPEKTELSLYHEPEIFALFVEFVIRGGYILRDDLNAKADIRQSAQIWVFSQYLKATEFQNFAMQNLYDIFKGMRSVPAMIGLVCDLVCSYRPATLQPRSTVYPVCLRELRWNSPLYRFYLDVTVTHWSNKKVVVDYENPLSWASWSWNDVFVTYSYFRDDLLMAIHEGESHLKPSLAYQVVEQGEEIKTNALDDKAEEGFVEWGVSGNTTVTSEGFDTPAATDGGWLRLFPPLRDESSL